jgi:hypothetical protein
MTVYGGTTYFHYSFLQAAIGNVHATLPVIQGLNNNQGQNGTTYSNRNLNRYPPLIHFYTLGQPLFLAPKTIFEPPIL